jgi:hypothetical protein
MLGGFLRGGGGCHIAGGWRTGGLPDKNPDDPVHLTKHVKEQQNG